MNLLYPTTFKQYSNIAAVVSLTDSHYPGNNSMLPVEIISKAEAANNRKQLAKKLGFGHQQIFLPKLEHGNKVFVVNPKINRQLGDALVTNKAGILIGVTAADCIPLLIYDPAHNAVAAIHAGWRGLACNVIKSVIDKLQQVYGSKPRNLFVYIGPAAGKKSYVVKSDVKNKFANKYFNNIGNGQFLFDTKKVAFDQLVALKVPKTQIELSAEDTIIDQRFHSYRRDKEQAGRMLAVIGTKPNRH